MAAGFSRHILIVTISAKAHIVHTSIYIGKKKRNFLIIINELTHAAGNYLQVLMGSVISQRSFKSMKTIYHLTRLAMESSKTFVSFP